MSTHAKSAMTMSVMTVISRITGLLRWSAIGAALGLTVSHVADAYQLANILPHMVYELVLGGILTSVFIPIFVQYKTQKTEKEAWEVANRILTLALLTLSLMTLLSWLLADQLVAVQSLAGQPELRRLAVYFFYFFAPQIIFYGIGAIFGGMLNTYNNFVIPALVPILNNLIVITTAVLYYFYPDKIGIMGLALGTTLGAAVMAIAQLPSLYKLGWRYRWILDFKDPAVKKFFYLATPMFFYVALNQVALTVRNNFAASIQGGVAAMQYGFTFFQLPYGIFSVSIMTVLYPTLSRHGVEKDWQKFRETLSQGIRWSAFIIIPCTVGYLCLSEPIIRLIMERGKFHAQDTLLLSNVLKAYSFALLPYTLTLLFSRSFFALQDTRTPTVVVLIGVILTALGCWLLVKPLGVPGISFAYGMQYVGMSVLLWILLRKKIQRFEGRRIIKSLSKSILASGIMGLALYVLIDQTSFMKPGYIGNFHPNINPTITDIFTLGFTILLGSLIYISMSRILGTEEFIAMKSWIRRKRIVLE